MAHIKDIYAHATDKIIAELENGTRPWMQPCNAEHAAGRITRQGKSIINMQLKYRELPDLSHIFAFKACWFASIFCVGIEKQIY